MSDNESTEKYPKVTLQEYGSTTYGTRWVYTHLDWDFSTPSEPYVEPKVKWRVKTKRKIGRWLHDRFLAYCYEGIE